MEPDETNTDTFETDAEVTEPASEPTTPPAEIPDDDPILEPQAPEERVVAIYVGETPRMFQYDGENQLAIYGDEVAVTEGQRDAARYLVHPNEFDHDQDAADRAFTAMSYTAPPEES